VKVLLDTNVVLDLMLDREPWAQAAAKLFSRVESGTLIGYLGATTVTTIYYLATKIVGAKTARQEIQRLLTLCAVAPVNRPVLETALALGFADFEDAVLHEAARQVDAEAIVTRDPTGFKNATLSILTPDECLGILDRITDGTQTG
jgi:predicted nucleic acid-binding protein